MDELSHLCGSEGYAACEDAGGGRGSLLDERGDTMPITLTFHIFGLVFTIRVKRENRHSGK